MSTQDDPDDQEEDRQLTWAQTPLPIRQAITQAAGGRPDGHWRCPRLCPGGGFKPDSVAIEYGWLAATGAR